MKDIISCSRRTDIPWWYYKWLQETLKARSIELVNPYSNTKYTVDLSPENVHSMVLWSKNYDNILRDPGFLSKYNLYFQFTVNGYSEVLEPNVPPLSSILKQMEMLADTYSPEQINWRFDPIVLSKDGEVNPTDKVGRARLDMFKSLCDNFSSNGITRCTISFIDLYDKVKVRLNSKNFEHVTPTEDQVLSFTRKVVEIAEAYGVQVYSCSSPIIEGVEGVERGQCVDGAILTKLFGERATKAKDQGQRKACGCSKSKDIGQYTQKCFGNCLYCYANPNE